MCKKLDLVWTLFHSFNNMNILYLEYLVLVLEVTGLLLKGGGEFMFVFALSCVSITFQPLYILWT